MASDFLIPDFVDPRLWAEHLRGAATTGEKALACAVFLDGIEDYLCMKTGPMWVDRQERAAAWVATHGLWYGSFDGLCELFNIDGARARAAIISSRAVAEHRRADKDPLYARYLEARDARREARP